jgi:hypothetical protein
VIGEGRVHSQGKVIKVAFAPKIGELLCSRLSSYLLSPVGFQLYGNAINYIIPHLTGFNNSSQSSHHSIIVGIKVED